MSQILRKIAIINGPNLNLLGTREPGVYGRLSLNDIQSTLVRDFKDQCELSFFQSNSEGEIVDYIQALPEKNIEGVVINAAAFTHTSVAIRDSLLAVNLPYVEVHLSNVYAREEFRHRSLLADKAVGVLCGFGPLGYELALAGILGALESLEN